MRGSVLGLGLGLGIGIGLELGLGLGLGVDCQGEVFDCKLRAVLTRTGILSPILTPTLNSILSVFVTLTLILNQHVYDKTEGNYTSRLGLE